MVTLTFEALQPQYKEMLGAMKATRMPAAVVVAKRLLASRDRFLGLQTACGVPALWVMPVFEREQPSFDAYLGNGDPLSHPTTHVPRGRGPFSTWEEGAADALALDHVAEPATWTWEWACWQWEKWNGFGPREHGRPTGYLWSGTDQYKGGKYVSDGVWSPRTFDQQLGTVILAEAIVSLDPEIASGFQP
jgi:lysozyme family protein